MQPETRLMKRSSRTVKEDPNCAGIKRQHNVSGMPVSEHLHRSQQCGTQKFFLTWREYFESRKKTCSVGTWRKWADFRERTIISRVVEFSADAPLSRVLRKEWCRRSYEMPLLSGCLPCGLGTSEWQFVSKMHFQKVSKWDANSAWNHNRYNSVLICLILFHIAFLRPRQLCPEQNAWGNSVPNSDVMIAHLKNNPA